MPLASAPQEGGLSALFNTSVEETLRATLTNRTVNAEDVGSAVESITDATGFSLHLASLMGNLDSTSEIGPKDSVWTLDRSQGYSTELAKNRDGFKDGVTQNLNRSDRWTFRFQARPLRRPTSHRGRSHVRRHFSVVFENAGNHWTVSAQAEERSNPAQA